MKRIWGLLATSAICCSVGACANDGTWNMASNDDMNHAQTGMHDNMSNSGAHDMNAMNNNNSKDNPQLREGSDKTRQAAATTSFDRGFLQEASSGGMYEVQAGMKAVAKGTDTRVKTIGQHMVDDHTKANQQLAALAMRKGVEVSGLPNADQVKMLAKLDSLNGSDFDREYLSQQQMAHQDMISKFQVASSNATDRDVRDWAAQTLPTLREHLRTVSNGTGTNVGSDK